MRSLYKGVLLASSGIATMTAVGLGLGVAQAAIAADPPNSDTAVQEIVVTAEKRQESINDVGMPITAVTGLGLKERGVATIDDFSKVEPSFTYAQSLSGTPVYSVRGVGYNDFALAAPPAVSIYTDEVPIPYSAETKGASIDLQQVEILKGPQGTLFGENSTGGAINFIAAKPTQAFAAGIEATYARFGAVNLNGFVSGPISEHFRVRLALNADEGGAWQNSQTQNLMLGDKRFLSGRFIGDWTPTDKLDVLINLNGWGDRSDTQAAQLVGFVNPAVTAATNPAILASPLAPHNAQAADWGPDTDPRHNDHFYQGSVRVNYDLSPSAKLTSITALSRFRDDASFDIDGVRLSNLADRLDGNIDSFFQEFRLSGTALDRRLSWVTGVNYATDKTTDVQHVQVTDSIFSFTFTPFGAPRWDEVANLSKSDVVTKAAFANLDYKLTDTLSVHAGARYTDSRDAFTGCTFDGGDGLFAAGINAAQAALKGGVGVVPVAPGGCATLDATDTPGLVHHSLNQNNVAWQAGAKWKFAADGLLYVTVTKGYKAGSFPTQGAPFASELNGVTQESVLSYEAGVKADFFDKAVHVDGSVFHYDYTNKQIDGSVAVPFIGNLFSLINVPKSAVDGAELSTQWIPLEGLTLSGAVTYLDSRVEGDFFNTDSLGDTLNFKGEAFPLTPKWAAVAGANYEWSLTSDLRAFAAADYSYRTATHFGFGELEAEKINAYGLLDLRGGIKSATGKWSVEAWGRNVTNTYYWYTATVNPDTESRLAGMPVTYGVTLRYSFE